MASKTKISPAEVQKVLGGIDYPADKQALLKHAKDRGASGEIISALNSLPSKEYLNSTDVSADLGADSGQGGNQGGDNNDNDDEME